MSQFKFGASQEPRFKSAPVQETQEPEVTSNFVDRTLETVSGMVEGSTAPVHAHIVEIKQAAFLMPALYGLIVFAVTAVALRQLQKAWLRRSNAAAKTAKAT